MAIEKLKRSALVVIEGQLYEKWTSLEVGLDLANLAGIFRVVIALSTPVQGGELPKLGSSVQIYIANFPVLKGWLEAINGSGDEHSLHMVLSGRDLAGDIVDCTAQPEGPGRFDHVRLETVVGSLINPYGLSARTVVDTGAPFEVVAFEPGTSVLDAIEKQSRQRGVLVTSDGQGGIVLTKPGDSRADENLTFPGGNVQRFEVRQSQSFSDHIVKAQGKSHHHRHKKSAFSAGSAAGSVPLTTGYDALEKQSVCAFGYCHDGSVGRYRPRVYVAGTTSEGQKNASRSGTDLASILSQSRGQERAGWNKPAPPTQKETAPRQDGQPYGLDDQAAWRMRTSRAQGSARVYVVPRLVTVKNTLWRPNQLVRVKDDVNGVDGDMLIGAVTWVISGEGQQAVRETRISVVPPDAYDLTGEMDHTPTHGQISRKHGKAWRRV